MGTRVFKAAVVVAATTGIGVGMLTPLAAHAAVVCGQVITSSMTLDQSLNCPTGNGVTINSHNVVLDLGGFTISGGAPSGGNRRGVSVTFDHHGVVIRNGAIRGFDSGVSLSGRADGTISGLILDGNGLGIATQPDSSGSRIRGNTIVNTTQFSGMQLGGNAHIIEDNTVNNSNGTGIFVSGSNNLIQNNKINGAGANAINIGTFPSNPGPFANNRIIANSLSGSSRVFNSSSISINNGSGTLIQGNVGNGRRSTPGVFVNESVNSVVAGNTLVNHSTGVQIRGAGSTGTRVTGNTVGGNAFAGINVETGPTGTIVADNVAANNDQNGIDVRSASTTITRNTAYANGARGIFAVAGVTDGGGNRAFANGGPVQCSPTIVCSS